MPARSGSIVYFIVIEALNIVVEHSHAEHAEARATVEDGTFRVEPATTGWEMPIPVVTGWGIAVLGRASTSSPGGPGYRAEFVPAILRLSRKSVSVSAPTTAAGLLRSGDSVIGREIQSRAFLSCPGSERLYSGVRSDAATSPRGPYWATSLPFMNGWMSQ
jgi:hypothetical protein